MGDWSRRTGDRTEPLPHRGRGGQRERRQNTERPGPARFPRERAVRGAEPVRKGQGNSSAIGTRARTSFRFNFAALDNERTGTALGLPALLALCSGLLETSIKGGLIVVGALNLGGSVEPLTNAVGVVEAAVEKGAFVVLMPVSARKQLFDLSDDMATRINVQFYSRHPGRAAEGAAGLSGRVARPASVAQFFRLKFRGSTTFRIRRGKPLSLREEGLG